MKRNPNLGKYLVSYDSQELQVNAVSAEGAAVHFAKVIKPTSDILVHVTDGYAIDHEYAITVSQVPHYDAVLTQKGN